MKVYKTQQQVEKDIKDGVLNCKGEDVKFECSISIKASIIYAMNINAGDINAWDIDARDINAGDIYAMNINAGDINARNINYFASCLSYNSIKCKSIEGRRNPHQKPVCLDGELTIREDF